MTDLEFRNLKLRLSWNGRNFNGYQYQPHAFTVQEAINKAWKILAREDVVLHGCSRLDAGVHADKYILNFHTKCNFATERILKGLNGIFQSEIAVDICVYDVSVVPSDFHARYHSSGKHYRYLVWSGTARHTRYTKRAWHTKRLISLEKMAETFKSYEGEHDFSAFRNADCSSKKTLRKISRIDAWMHPNYEELLIVDIWGDGFLKNMIRNMVGTSYDIISGKLSENTIQEAFVHKERVKVGQCAPPHALTLMDVYYQKELLHGDAEKGSRHLVPN